jgi:hypothetical protein
LAVIFAVIIAVVVVVSIVALAIRLRQGDAATGGGSWGRQLGGDDADWGPKPTVHDDDDD